MHVYWFPLKCHRHGWSTFDCLDWTIKVLCFRNYSYSSVWMSLFVLKTPTGEIHHVCLYTVKWTSDSMKSVQNVEKVEAAVVILANIQPWAPTNYFSVTSEINWLQRKMIFLFILFTLQKVRFQELEYQQAHWLFTQQRPNNKPHLFHKWWEACGGQSNNIYVKLITDGFQKAKRCFNNMQRWRMLIPENLVTNS